MSAGNPGMRMCLVLLVIVPQATLAAFVPAVPHIAMDLGTSPAAVDRSLVFYMAGYAVSMAAAGALASRVGPRKVQLVALAVHAVASVAVAFAPSIGLLTTARVVQALGGGAGTVLARVYVQEALPENQRMAALTGLSTAIALTPAITPAVVGVLVDHFPWRPVVLGLTALSVVTFVLARRWLPDSASATGGPGLRSALTRPAYWWFTAGICLAWCVYFTFTTFSSHTLQVHLGTSSTMFSLLYALVIVGYVVGSRTARRLNGRFELEHIMLVAGVVSFGATACMALGTYLRPEWPLALVLPMTVAMIGVGAAFPVCQAGMLRAVGDNARSASGLFFFLQMTSGAVYTGTVSIIDPTLPLALSITILIPAAALATLVAFKPNKNVQHGLQANQKAPARIS